MNPEAIRLTTPVNVDVSDSESIFDTPRKIALKAQVHKLQKQKLHHQVKIKKIGQQNRYLKRKILNLKDFVNHLEKKFDIQKNVVNSLKTTAETQALYDRLYSNSSKAGLSRRKFCPSLRKFALTLHYYSPAAYNYARKCFNKVFPHVRTLRRWYVSIDAQPGFTNESFRALKLKRIKTGKELICSLVFDEISIRRQKIWNTKTNEGFVNLGFGDIKDEIASQALVFMVVSLDQKWKIPVGYFFINSIKAEFKATLIRQCLSLCHEVGVKIVSMTFDGAPTNLSTAEILGCKLTDPDNLKSDFPHPVNQESVVIFLDPSHMIKLIRNTFESKKMFYDAQNEKIKWSLLVSLNKLQTNEQLHFANKLTNKHIHFRNQIMKVRLATQLLSRSVAKALLLCNELLTGKAFEDVSGTVKFISIINDLFDIMNSNKYGKYGFKQPLNSKNVSTISNFFELAKNYILSLKQYIKIRLEIKRRNLPNRIILKIIKKRLVDTINKTGFLGFLINIQSLQTLFEIVVKTQKIQYLSTYRLSQDHLELFFGCIRRHGGHNNNPNVIQFKAAYKKILANLELRDSFSGNCAPMDNFSILTCSSVETVNSTCILRDVDNEDFQLDEVLEKEFETDFQVSENCEFLSGIINETSVSVGAYQIIGYISGYVSRILSRKIKCEICVSSLVSNRKLDFHKLITVRDMGGLYFSSKSVFDVCKATEIFIRKLINQNDGKGVSIKHSIDFIKMKVLKVFIHSNIFEGLIIHSFESPAMLNHRLYLIRSIIETYANIKLRFVAKFDPGLQNKSKRQKFTKLILFEGT